MAMNKYLDKIASLETELNDDGTIKVANMNIRKDTHMGHVLAPEQVRFPGAKLSQGAKTLFDRALLKSASTFQEQHPNWKHDAIDTGVIGSIGAATGFATHKLAPKIIGEGGRFHDAKYLALSGVTSLAADYAGVKLNKMISNHVDKQVS